MTAQYTATITRLTSNDDGWRDPGKCQLAVVHTYECPPGDNLMDRAAYQETAGSSYTILVGLTKTLRANDDDYNPWAAGYTANRRGLHVSALAYAADSRAAWMSRPGQLGLIADVLADWCTRYGIPPVKLTAAEIRAGKRGICGHGDTSAAWGETDHTDPGTGFPWDYVIDLVLKKTTGTPTTPTTDKDIDMTPEQDKLLRDNNALLKTIAAQMCGDGNNFGGWPQTGGRTLTDLTGAIAAKVGVPGTADTKAGDRP